MGVEVRRIVLESASANHTATADFSETVLVVDDDIAVAESVAIAIRSLGYQAVVVGDGRETLQRLKTTRFDAILLDIKMPEMDGLAVLRRIFEHDPRAIVLMLTAVEDEQVATEATQLGASGFLTKPCNISLLQFTWSMLGLSASLTLLDQPMQLVHLLL